MTKIERSRERQLADLTNVQQHFTLSRIMTPRADFICCTSGESTQAVMARIPEIYDAVPVVEGDNPRDVSAPVIGLLFRDRVPFRNSAALAEDVMDSTVLSNAHPSDRNLVVYMRQYPAPP